MPEAGSNFIRKYTVVDSYKIRKHFEQFIQKVRKTKNARFEAYRRMKRRKMSSNLSISLLSFSMIVFNIFQLSPIYSQYHTSITFVTIILSALILSISLLINNMNYGERELKYYQCGLELSRMEDNLNLLKDENFPIDAKSLKEKIKQYHDCLSGWGINHISTDHKIALLKEKLYNNPSEEDRKNKDNDGWKASCGKKIKIGWYSILDVNILYWVLALAIPALGYFMIFVWNIFGDHKTA